MGIRTIVSGFLQDKKKLWHASCRCPYMLCGSNQPFRGAYEPRMKFVQKIAPTIYQFKCKDCGCLTNFGFESEPDLNHSMAKRNPALIQKKPSYTPWGK